jgi:hypothetical protein
VAILDTGIDMRHPLVNKFHGVRIIDAKSFVPGEAGFFDTNGHGTLEYKSVGMAS